MRGDSKWVNQGSVSAWKSQRTTPLELLWSGIAWRAWEVVYDGMHLPADWEVIRWWIHDAKKMIWGEEIDTKEEDDF